MRRGLAFLAALLLMASLALGVSASSITGIKSSTSVSIDGSCQVAMTVNLNLDSVVSELSIPLPLGARSITVNGSSVSTFKEDGAVQADISRMVKNMTGQFSLLVQFSLSGCVATDELGRTILTVPLLSGFSIPVEGMEFTVSLPGEPVTKPTFTSGYYQSSIESMMEFEVDGTVITGECTKTLKDRETLSMSVEMPGDLFPQQKVQEWTVAFDDTAMILFAALAFLYWLLFLRCLPPRRVQRSLAPEGLSAGTIGSALTAQGAELTMMVLSWAQLGYILIHLDNHGRVMLHKRMDMGNERSGFENKVFRSLFGKKQMVDGTGYHYAVLCKRVSRTPPDIHDYFRRGSGNPLIFRVLACGIGSFGGMSLGFAMSSGAFLTYLVVFIMVILGTVSAWFIQSAATQIHLRDQWKQWIGLGCCIGWLIFGAMAGQMLIAALVISGEFLAGLAAAYGGRRTDLGRQTMAEILGLRRYLRKAPKGEVQRITRNTPDYFFSLIPYAMALGVGEKFAAQFGSMQLPGCPYLTTGMDGHRTAAEWYKLVDTAVSRLDARQKRLTWQRLTGR